jgi:hypothetical protein
MTFYRQVWPVEELSGPFPPLRESLSPDYQGTIVGIKNSRVFNSTGMLKERQPSGLSPCGEPFSGGTNVTYYNDSTIIQCPMQGSKAAADVTTKSVIINYRHGLFVMRGSIFP